MEDSAVTCLSLTAENMIAHVDGDDIQFLDLVDEDEKKKEREREQELQRELDTFRNHVVKVDDPISVAMVAPPKSVIPPSKKDAQKAALAHIVKKRKTPSEDAETRPHPDKPPTSSTGTAATTTTTKSAPPAPTKSATPAAKGTSLLGINYSSSSEDEEGS